MKTRKPLVVVLAFLLWTCNVFAFPAAPPLTCTSYLLLNDVVVSDFIWCNPRNGECGCATSITHLAQTGHFWFFNPTNIESTIKVLDGTPLNGAKWVFVASLTDVEFWFKVRDNANPFLSQEFYNSPFHMASQADTGAIFPGPNHAAKFANTAICGRTFAVQRSSTSALNLTALDSDGDLITTSATAPANAGCVIERSWQGTVVESGTQLEVLVTVPNAPGTHKVTISIDDGQSEVPTQCEVTLLVP